MYRFEEINHQLGSVNLYPTDIPYNSFEIDEKVILEPSKLKHNNPDKAKITEAVIKMLEKMTELSNVNLVKNADGLLSKRSADTDIE